MNYDIEKILKRKIKEVERWVRDDLPRQAGKTAVDHFRENFVREGFMDVGVKEALNQPHEFIQEKNEAIRNIKQIIHEAHRVLYRPDDKDNQMVAGYHYLEFELAGEKSYIVIRETKDGRLMFYSVVDKIKGR